MSNWIRVWVNKMSSDSQRLQELTSTLPQIIEKLRASMDRLSTCWEGTAWEAFQGQVASDVEYMNGLYRFLVNHIERLENSSQKYLEEEQKAYSGANGIWI